MAKLPTDHDIFSDPFRRPVLYNPNKKAFVYIDNKGVYRQLDPGVVPVPSSNTYPLSMPAVAAGAPIVAGTGPDEIQLRISGNPDSISMGPPVFDVFINGTHIANDFRVTDFAGQNNGQYFTFRGTWGPAPQTIQLVPSMIVPGLANGWVTAVAYNSMPCYCNDVDPNSRNFDGHRLVNELSVWDNTNQPLTFTTFKADETPTPPVPTLSVITGALIDGSPTTDGTLAELAAKTPDGGLLKLPAGTFAGTSPVGSITIEGAGPGVTIIDATGLPLAGGGKAALMPTSTTGRFVSKDLTIRGAKCPDRNGAAIRQNGDGMNFSAINCEITDCENGLLTFSGDIVVDTCHIHHCGASNGLSHGVYANGTTDLASKLTVIKSKIECNDMATHAVKSRMATTVIEDCELTQNTSLVDGAPVAGRIVDIPNGGDAKINRTTLNMTPSSPVREVISYGANGLTNGAQGLALDTVLLNTTGLEEVYIDSFVAVPLSIVNGTYNGGAPALVGWLTPTGAFTPVV